MSAPDAPPGRLLLAAPGLLLAALVLLPFLGKAYTIDDVTFLLQAEHLLHDPLHPTAFEIVLGEVPQRLSSIMVSGPLMAYLLLPVARLGGAEWVAHAIQLAFVWLGVLSTVSLALRLGLGRWQAALAGLLLSATPAVLGMAGTAMPDVPAMALGVTGVDQLLAWRERHRWPHALAAGVALALSVLARSHMVTLVLLSGLLLLPPPGAAPPRAPWWSPRHVSPLLLAFALIGLVVAITDDPARAPGQIVGATGATVRPLAVPGNLVAALSYYALSMPLALPLLLLSPWRSPRPFLEGVSIFSALVILLTGSPRSVWAAPLCGICAAVLVGMLRHEWGAGRERRFLALWPLLGFSPLFYMQMAPKYLVPAAPAVALLVARAAAGASPRRAWRVLGATVALGVLLGVLILRADQAFAGLGRRAAAELIAPAVAKGRQVWFAGHWGFHVYAQRAGARPLTSSPPHPAPGDLVVRSAEADGGNLLMRFPRRRLVGVLSDATPGGRVMSHRDGAAFFSNGWGYLPWAWGWGEIDRYTVWEIW